MSFDKPSFIHGNTQLQDNCSVTEPCGVEQDWNMASCQNLAAGHVNTAGSSWRTTQDRVSSRVCVVFFFLRQNQFQTCGCNFVHCTNQLKPLRDAQLVLVQGGFIFPVTCASKMHGHSSWVSAHHVTQRTNDLVCELFRRSANQNIIS